MNKKIENGKIKIIDKKYVIKKDSENALRAANFFIQNNENLKVQKILKSDLINNYNVYEYIDGDTIHKLEDVENCLFNIYEIINKYTTLNINKYGFIFDLKNKWTDFLRNEIIRQSKYIKDSNLNLKKQVTAKIEILEKYQFKPKLIHGDMGCFNLICKNKKIVGIIDPRTLIGDPLYDFVYFSLSSYTIAKEIDFKQFFTILENEPKEKIFAMIYVLLYDRIAREQKNNTKNKYNFYNIWKKIEELEKKLIISY